MKKSISIIMALTAALLFTGCVEDTFLDEDTEEMEQSLELEAQEEVTEECAEENDAEKINLSEHQELTEDKEAATLILSEEELARMRLIAEEYYTSINRKMLDFTRADPVSSFNREYEGYGHDEVVLFEVSVENSENKRYIAIGSKDGWNSCNILNEGY
ncbi:MAG: hypothetical protein K2L07_10345 [Lachnospiraceae bacterium]|nr:hypothetical protein [Lachnospiraceae bacterium]